MNFFFMKFFKFSFFYLIRITIFISWKNIIFSYFLSFHKCRNVLVSASLILNSRKSTLVVKSRFRIEFDGKDVCLRDSSCKIFTNFSGRLKIAFQMEVTTQIRHSRWKANRGKIHWGWIRAFVRI